jgi:hypothetical protein
LDEPARLATSVRVGVLLRRVAAEGGFGTVLARGDPTAGALALVLRDRSAEPVVISRALGPDGYAWRDMAAGEAVQGWIDRARRIDPDLWVVELDIPDAARFVAETLGRD